MVPPGVQKRACQLAMHNSSWMYPYDPTEDLHAFVLSNMESGEMSRPQRLLHEAFLKIPGDSWQAKLDHYASCKCCTRHQTFRPRQLVHWSDSDADRVIKLHHRGPKCKCDCRHMARFICRNIGTTCPLASPILEDEM
jgi:hypothetical protein